MAVKSARHPAQRSRVPAPPGPRARGALALLAVAAAGAGLFCCYLRLAATFPGGSDGASNALEAWDMLHGNWLLRGWTLTDVSFYTTELPEYAALEAARGLNPGVLRAAPALTYTLLVLAAGLLARGRARGRQGLARALVAAGVMIAPQLGNGVHVLLAQPDHVGTQVLVLGALLLLERAPRRWWTAAALWALLTAGIVADKIVIVDAVVPLAFAALLHAAWARRPAPRRFAVSVAVAAVAAAGAAQGLLTLVSRAGGFTLLPVRTALIAPGEAPAHLALAWHGVLSLFGADVSAAVPGTQAVLAWLHVPGAALALAAFAVAAWRVPDQGDLTSDVLAVGIVVNLAGFVASVIPATPFDTREMAALLPFGAVLAGRVFGSRLAGAGAARPRPAAVALAAALLAAAGAGQLAALGYGAAQPAVADPEQALAGWLRAHGLTSGLGTYTEDNLTTLDSDGTVRLRTVSWQPRTRSSPGGAVPRLYQSSSAWYDPRTQYADFVVSGTADGTADLIPRADELALAGPPARTYHFRSFTVMVWDVNLIPLLGGPPSVHPGNIGHS